MQLPPEAHDTPFSWVSIAPVGFGVVLICQAVPFHDSAQCELGARAVGVGTHGAATCVPEPSSKVPTAMQEVGLLQASAKRLPCETVGRAGLCSVQTDFVAFADGIWGGMCLPAVDIWTDRLDAASAAKPP
jgi:hypothetical protein